VPIAGREENRCVKQSLEDALDRLRLVCGVPADPCSLLSADLPSDLAQPARTALVDLGLESVAAWWSAGVEAVPSTIRDAIAETDLALVPGSGGARLVVLTDRGGRVLSDCAGPIEGVVELSFEPSVSTEIRLAAVARLRSTLRAVIWAGGQFDQPSADALARCESLDALRVHRGTATAGVRWSIAQQLRVLWGVGAMGPEVFSSPRLEELSLLGHRLDAASIKSVVALGKVRSVWVHGGYGLTDAQLKTLAKLPLEEVVISMEKLKAKAGAALATAPTLMRVSLRDCAIDDSTVTDLARLPKLTRLDLTGTPITDGCARALGQMRALRELVVDRTGVGPEAMAAVGSLPALVRLSADSCAGVAASLAGLAKSRSLAWVSFDGCGLGDDAVGELSQVATVERLSISNARLSAEGAAKLARLGALRRLDVHHTPLGDVPVFASLGNLEALSAWGCGLTMRALAGLGSSGRLVELDLSDNELGPDMGGFAARIASLRHLRLDHVGLTEAGLSHLASADLPLLQLGLAKNQLGGSTGRHCARMPSLRFLQLGANPLGDEGTIGLERLSELRTLMLDGTGISAGTAKRLSTLTRLRSLVVNDNRIDAAGYRALAALPRLERLDLVNNPMGDELALATATSKLHLRR
jgi:Leucine-rich repeat (LRR) protein